MFSLSVSSISSLKSPFSLKLTFSDFTALTHTAYGKLELTKASSANDCSKI